MRELFVDLYDFELGLKASMSDVILSTLQRLPDEVLTVLSSDKTNKTLRANFVYGFDGSGDHSEYNSAEVQQNDIDTSHFVIAGMALSCIMSPDGTTMAWYDEKMSSSSAERPLVIAPGRENEDLVQKVTDLLDKEAKEVGRQMMLCIYVILSIFFHFSSGSHPLHPSVVRSQWGRIHTDIQHLHQIHPARWQDH